MAGLPPNGFAGAAQQTQATQMLLRKHMGARTRNSTTKRRKRGASSGGRKRRTRTTASRGKKKTMRARLVKGSAAAKRYMAKIRKLKK